MFNKHVIISALECPVDYEVASGDDWNELRDAIAAAKGTDPTSMLAEFEAQTFKRVGYVTSFWFADKMRDGYAMYTLGSLGDSCTRGVWWTDTKDQVFFTGVVDSETVGGVLNTVGAPIVPGSETDSLWTLLTPMGSDSGHPPSDNLGFPVRLVKKVAA